jgi:hypothetical protein
LRSFKRKVECLVRRHLGPLRLCSIESLLAQNWPAQARAIYRAAGGRAAQARSQALSAANPPLRRDAPPVSSRPRAPLRPLGNACLRRRCPSHRSRQRHASPRGRGPALVERLVVRGKPCRGCSSHRQLPKGCPVCGRVATPPRANAERDRVPATQVEHAEVVERGRYPGFVAYPAANRDACREQPLGGVQIIALPGNESEAVGPADVLGPSPGGKLGVVGRLAPHGCRLSLLLFLLVAEELH